MKPPLQEPGRRRIHLSRAQRACAPTKAKAGKGGGFQGRPAAALATDTGEPEWSAYSGALGGKFPRLDAFLKEKESTAKKSA